MRTIKWEPPFTTEIIESEEDGDYLRRQQCCTSCGAYTADLPGYYWIEDDNCPLCRESNSLEKWSDELKRVLEGEGLVDDFEEYYRDRCDELKI